MKIIYQIGRLEQQLKTLKFKFEGYESESELSSFCLKEYFKDKAKVVLIFPVSLPFNQKLISSSSNLSDDFKREIKEVLNDRERYLKNPYEFFKKHPHFKKADDLMVIHSIGEYEGSKFAGSYNDIVLEIFLDMAKRYLEGFSELYVEISTGLNIYVSALLEAARHFFTFAKLMEWENKDFKIYKVFSDPVIFSSAVSYEIYKEEMKFKVFFSSPISKKEDIDDYKLARKIAKMDRQLKKGFKVFLKILESIFLQ